MKRFLLVIALVSLFVSAFAETWAERKLPNGGYARVAYMGNEGALYASIQTELKTEYTLDITVTCTHRWKTDDITNSDGTISPDTWNEEQYTICNNIFKNIPANKMVTLTEGVNFPPKNKRMDYYTDFNVTINNSMSASKNTYRMVFYVWKAGTDLGPEYEKSKTGHAFVYVPQKGHIGFSGEYWFLHEGVFLDHSDLRKFATDSCVIYISNEQLVSVKNKLQQLENDAPNYNLGTNDCTSFVMDMADAAGIKYGTRIDVQTPVYFMEKLKKYNSSNSK